MVSCEPRVFACCFTRLPNNRSSFISYFATAFFRSKRFVSKIVCHSGNLSNPWNRAVRYGEGGKESSTELDPAAKLKMAFACAGVSYRHRSFHFHGAIHIRPGTVGG